MYVAGLDLGGQEWDVAKNTKNAKQIHDASVLTIGRVVTPPSDAIVQEPRLEVVEHLALTGDAHDALFARLADVLGDVWRVRRLAVDATGLGETLARLLTRALGADVVQPVRFTAQSKSRLGYELVAAVNGGRLKTYAPDGSPEHAEFWRQVESTRVSYRPNQTLNFFVPPSDGHDDYVVSLALAVEAAREMQLRPRIARGHITGMD